MKSYTETEVNDRLNTLPGWEFRADGLEKTFLFADFVAAFGFMARVAIHAEKADHHPEWSNVWNRVHIRLSTHDAGNTVTNRDLDLATIINAIA